jgi:hypothetical protein
VAIRDRLRRLEGDGPKLCADASCVRIVVTEVRYQDGQEVLLKGTPPPPPCGMCPYSEGGGPINHIQVVYDACTTDEDASRGATSRSKASSGARRPEDQAPTSSTTEDFGL